MNEPEHEPLLYLELTESQARKLASCDPQAIREYLVAAAEFAIDCEFGPLKKHAEQPVPRPKRRARQTV